MQTGLHHEPGELNELRELVAALQGALAEVKTENQLLRQKLEYFLKRYLGGTKTESLDPKQLELLLAGRGALHAGDGRYLEHTTHDPMIGETRWATGHFFALNLKSQSLSPLVLADRVARKKEHDIRALKRQSVALLRQGAGKGRKVLRVWDKAGVSFPFWQERKAGGIYFLSLRKEGMCLEVEREREIDFARPINQGVTADRVMVDRRGLRVREITFCNPCDGAVHVHLTSEMTLEPGLLVLLYRTDRESEKVFDEMKTKLAGKKSWATSDTAKEMQARFVALAHNLLLLMADWHEAQGTTEGGASENGRDAADDLHGAAAVHAGDAQAHPLAARPLAPPAPAIASPAPPRSLYARL